MPQAPQSSAIMSLCALLVAALGAPVAHAQENDPRVREARTACAAGDVSKGVRLLAELYTETDDPLWVFNQGRCHQQQGQLQPAVNRFREYLRKTTGATSADVRLTRGEAEGYIREMESELNRDRPAEPVSPPRGSAPPVGEGGRPRLQTLGIVAGAVGVAGVLTGATFGVLTRRAQERADDGAGQAPLVPVDGTRAIASTAEDGRRYERLQWIGYVAGAAGIVTGVTLYLLGRRESSEPRPVVPAVTTDGRSVVLWVGF